jgi:hypothetical protein
VIRQRLLDLAHDLPRLGVVDLLVVVVVAAIDNAANSHQTPSRRLELVALLLLNRRPLLTWAL